MQNMIIQRCSAPTPQCTDYSCKHCQEKEAMWKAAEREEKRLYEERYGDGTWQYRA